MITWYRSGNVAPGKHLEAVAWAKEIAAHVQSLTGIEVRVGLPVSGNPSRIGWSVQYESLAAMEAAQAKSLADQKYNQMVVQGAANFIGGSWFDEIWRQI